MKNQRLPFNCKPLDDLLGGGIEYKSLTNIYGPAGSGKTNLALVASVSCAEKGGKVIFIDTEGGFSVERLAQISKDFDSISKRIIITEPKTFEEQDKIIKDLDKLTEKAGLIVLDSLVTLYRLELNGDNFQEVNRKLANQLAMLSRIAREKNIPILITNQVYSDFEKNRVELTGRDIPRYLCKTLVELIKLDKGRRLAVLRKHRSMPEGKEVQFQIIQDGISPIEKKFSLF